MSDEPELTWAIGCCRRFGGPLGGEGGIKSLQNLEITSFTTEYHHPETTDSSTWELYLARRKKWILKKILRLPISRDVGIGTTGVEHGLVVSTQYRSSIQSVPFLNWPT
jgi:hypothetical protein